MNELVDYAATALGEALVALLARVVVALLGDALLVVLVVGAVVAAGRLPVVRRLPYAGRFTRDLDAGAHRVVVAPAQKMLRTGIPPRRLLWLLFAVVVVVAGVPVYARVPAVLIVLWTAGHCWGAREAGWWTHRRLCDALTTAGVLRPAREGEAPPSLSYRGKPMHDEHGSSVVVGLPGATFSDVVTKRERIAAALRVPTARLTVSQDEDDPANVVRFHVGATDRGETPATVATAPTTVWADPVRIGRDAAHGHPVTLATNETNTLIAGRPGSGKTSLARIPLAHYLLDPATRVHALDGKGSTDYTAARPLCDTFVSGTDDDAVRDTLAMLRDVLGTVRARNTAGGQHPGLLVLLEELQDVRAAATKAEREELDTLLGRIVRMGRAVSVHVLISTQRPSVDDLPSGTRNLLGQRVALALRNGQDAALVLGQAPTMSLPRARGQAIVDDGAGQRGVRLDRLTDAAWSAVCQRATALRSATGSQNGPQDGLAADERAATPGTPLIAADGHEEAPAPTTPVVDPLLGDVLAVLVAGDPAGLPASVLLDRLPGWARGVVPNAQALGTFLARHPAHVARRNVGKSRVWAVTPPGREVAADLTRGVGEPSEGAAEVTEDPR